MDRNKFGLYIKESRINKNYTQQELADLLFVDVTTVSKWERGDFDNGVLSGPLDFYRHTGENTFNIGFRIVLSN